jgi:hypothetical protein
MQPLRTALVVSALLAAAPVTVMAQASSTIERSVEDASGVIENPCNGELVQLTGTLTVRTRRTVDANGIVHLASNTVPSIRGEGPSGEYIVHEANHVRDKFVDFELFPENVSFGSDFRLITKGKALNFQFTLTGHLLIDADGVVKVDITHDSARCIGS